MEPLAVDLTDIDGCWFYVDFDNWAKVFVVVGLAYFWNLGLVLWTLPWTMGDNGSFPYLGSTLSVMFESERYGISIQNWRRLGKKRIDESNILTVAPKASFKFFIAIFTLDTWLLFAAKVAMFLTFGDSFYTSWSELGFTHFFNIEIALITLLMVSNIFFSFPILPSFQIASSRSSFVRLCLYLLYSEMAGTFIVLCIEYPLLIAVLYLGACIVLTGMILGMAILCLLALVIVSGSAIFWTLNVLTCCHFHGTRYLKAFSASITWLLITYLVWVSGVCLAFLFTTSNFESTLCFEMEGNLYEELALIFVVSAIIITLLSLFILHFAFGDMAPDPEPPSPVGDEKQYQYHQINHTPGGVEEAEQI